MPVPSTITGFRLTIVLMPCGRVASAQPFIMIGGPIATHLVDVGVLRDRLLDAVGDQALDARPSRRRCRRSARRSTARNLSSQNIEVLVAEAEHADHVGAAFLVARAPAG